MNTPTILPGTVSNGKVIKEIGAGSIGTVYKEAWTNIIKKCCHKNNASTGANSTGKRFEKAAAIANRRTTRALSKSTVTVNMKIGLFCHGIP